MGHVSETSRELEKIMADQGGLSRVIRGAACLMPSCGWSDSHPVCERLTGLGCVVIVPFIMHEYSDISIVGAGFDDMWMVMGTGMEPGENMMREANCVWW